MHNSIGIIACEKLCRDYHHIYFPYEKGYFLQLDNISQNGAIQQPPPSRSNLDPPPTFGVLLNA